MEALTVENVMELSGMLLYVPVIFCLVEVIKKVIPEQARNAWLPAISLGLGVLVLALPQYLGPSIEVWYRGILVGGVSTGLVAAYKGRKNGG